MPRVIDPDVKALLESGASFSVALLVDIEFPDQSSFEDSRLRFTTKLDNVEFNGATFYGLGSLGSVSMPNQDGDLSPSDYSVVLSAISDEILEAATQLNYLNHKATAYIQYMTEDFVDVGTPRILWQGLTDGADINYGKTSSISIRVKDRLVDWSRPRIEYYNNGDQQFKYPEDKGFEFIAQVATKDAKWPEAAWFEANPS